MYRIYVGNLSFRTTPEALKAYFEQHGEVLDAFIGSDRETGRSRGFGFVTMASKEAGAAAIAALNGKDFEGRALVVNEAQPRPERGAGGPRGGGGGYGGGGGGGYGGGGGGYGGGGGGGYGGGGSSGGGGHGGGGRGGRGGYGGGGGGGGRDDGDRGPKGGRERGDRRSDRDHDEW